MSFEIVRSSLRKQTLLKAKTEDLVRLAKWLKLDTKDLNHYALAGNIHFHLLYLS
jgi:hypothetical protein